MYARDTLQVREIQHARSRIGASLLCCEAGTRSEQNTLTCLTRRCSSLRTFLVSLVSYCDKVPYGGKLKACTSCKQVAYCDRECQKSHWKAHKVECKKFREASVKDTAMAAASNIKANQDVDRKDKENKKNSSESHPSEEPAVVVYNEKVAIARSRPTKDDPFVYQQFMPREAYTAYINATKMPCWCGDVGQRQSLLVAFVFDPSDLKGDGAPLRSTFMTAFGVNFQILVSRIVNNLSVDLAEEATALDDLKKCTGVVARCTYFFASGSDGRGLVIPPPSTGKFKRSGETTCNSHMATWCGVGMKMPMGLHSLSSIPRVPSSALDSQSFDNSSGVSVPDSAMCLAVMIEKVSDVATLEDFELSCVQANLHTYHAAAVPSAEVPDFCKGACRRGLDGLNMGHPVPLVGRIPDGSPFTIPPPEPTTPAGVKDLSPANLIALQNIMESIKHETPDMQGIEEALGDEEVSVSFNESRSDELQTLESSLTHPSLQLAPVLRGILSSPQVAPLFARMIGGVENN